jgi:hypothetical protein
MAKPVPAETNRQVRFSAGWGWRDKKYLLQRVPDPWDLFK